MNTKNQQPVHSFKRPFHALVCEFRYEKVKMNSISKKDMRITIPTQLMFF